MTHMYYHAGMTIDLTNYSGWSGIAPKLDPNSVVYLRDNMAIMREPAGADPRVAYRAHSPKWRELYGRPDSESTTANQSMGVRR